MLVRTHRVAIHHEHGPVGYANDALGSGAPETVAEAPTIRAEHDEIGIPLDRDVRDCLMSTTCSNGYLGTIARSRELPGMCTQNGASSCIPTFARVRGPRPIDDMQQKQLCTEFPSDGISTRHRTIRALQQISRT